VLRSQWPCTILLAIPMSTRRSWKVRLLELALFCLQFCLKVLFCFLILRKFPNRLLLLITKHFCLNHYTHIRVFFLFYFLIILFFLILSFNIKLFLKLYFIILLYFFNWFIYQSHRFNFVISWF
jgi:hypothetical protein